MRTLLGLPLLLWITPLGGAQEQGGRDDTSSHGLRAQEGATGGGRRGRRDGHVTTLETKSTIATTPMTATTLSVHGASFLTEEAVPRESASAAGAAAGPATAAAADQNRATVPRRSRRRRLSPRRNGGPHLRQALADERPFGEDESARRIENSFPDPRRGNETRPSSGAFRSLQADASPEKASEAADEREEAHVDIVEVSPRRGEGEGEGGSGGGAPLVPSFCPLEPFERYAALHENILQGKAAQRYLVFRPYLYCGMGNRLSGFKGVLFLAMLTDRALLVDWYSSSGVSSRTSHKYEDNFLQAHGVPHGDLPASLKDYETDPGTEIWCQMPNGVGISTPCSKSRMTPDFLPSATWDAVYAPDTKVVVVQAHNGSPSKFLADNPDPDVAEALARMAGDFPLDSFDRCALRFLLEAKPDFRSRYCAERSSVLGGKVATVSLHIRTGDNPNYHPEWYETLPQDVENFAACAAGLEEGLAAVAAGSAGVIREPDLELDLAGGGYGTVWLLGTDSDSAIDLMNHGNYTVGSGGKVAYIEGDKGHRVHSGGKGGVASTNAGPLIDLALLSEPPLMVESYHSTFSMHIAEIGGRPNSMRIALTTPFARIFQSSTLSDTLPATSFEDFHQGCRDFVMDPLRRDSLKLAVQASREPFIPCEE